MEGIKKGVAPLPRKTQRLRGLGSTLPVYQKGLPIPLAKSVGPRWEPASWVSQREPVGRTPLGFRSTGRLRQQYRTSFVISVGEPRNAGKGTCPDSAGLA